MLSFKSFDLNVLFDAPIVSHSSPPAPHPAPRNLMEASMDMTGEGAFDGTRSSGARNEGAREIVLAAPAQRVHDERTRQHRWQPRTVLLGAAAAVASAMAVASFVVSLEPDPFDTAQNAQAVAGMPTAEMAPGTYTATALVGVLDQLLNKPGGYLRNDVMPPFVLLDNMPAWERGVLTEVRDTVRALRDDLSRQQTQSAEDPDLVRADAQLHFDAESWMLPATEDEYREGRAALKRYVDRLQGAGAGAARFDVRADSLNFYLATVEKRLGAYAQRLAGSVGEIGLPVWLGGSPSVNDHDSVPWMEVDDVFYEARGYTWALIHTLRGIQHDYRDLLQAKAAAGPLERIIEKLEDTQATVLSPVIMNNSGFGLLTNHSLVMTSYISRANAAIIDFRLLLSEG